MGGDDAVLMGDKRGCLGMIGLVAVEWSAVCTGPLTEKAQMRWVKAVIWSFYHQMLQWSLRTTTLTIFLILTSCLTT